MSRRPAVSILVAALLVLGPLGCSSSQAPSPIWCGHVATLSGADREAGEQAVLGIRLAVEDINKDPDETAGRPFHVIHGDAHGKLEAFESEAVRLTAVNRVAFLLGGATAPEVERLDRARVPVLTPLGSRSRAMSEAVWCTGLSPQAQGKVLARVAALDLKATHVTIVEDDRDDLAQVRADAFSAAFVAEIARRDPKAVPSVQRLRFGKDRKAADVAINQPTEAILFAGPVADLRDREIPLLFAGDDGALRAIQAKKALAADVYLATAFAVGPEAPQATEFAKRFKAAFDKEPDVHAAVAYEGMKLLAAAVGKSADNLTGTRIKEELGQLKDVAGLLGPLAVAPTHQLRRPAVVLRVSGGAVTVARRCAVEET